jgi:hypothetical protein
MVWNSYSNLQYILKLKGIFFRGTTVEGNEMLSNCVLKRTALKCTMKNVLE